MNRKEIFLLFGLILILIFANIFLVWPLFAGEYDKNTASIGVAHILNARYLSRFWNHGWNPFWYGGFPNHLIYPLLAPISLAAVQKIFFFLSMAQVYRIVVATAYVLMPVTLFFLVRYFTKRNLIALFASIIYILAPSANYFLIPGFRVVGEALHFAPWQLSVIVDFGEGPHMIALSLVPLAIIAYWRLLRNPSFYKFLLTAILMGLIVSINLFSAYALGYFLLGVFFSEFILGKGKQKLFISLLLIPLIYGLIGYCYDVSMIVSLLKSGYMHPENVFRLPPITVLFFLFIFVIGPLIFILHEVFKKRPKFQNYFVLVIWFFIFWAIPFAFYKGIWFGSQPNRYMPELNMTTAIIMAVILVKLYDLVREKFGKLGIVAGTILLGCYLAILLSCSRGFIQNGWEFVEANQDIEATSEYKIAKWIEANTEYKTGERSFLTGSPAFFFNEFADVPQLRGDDDNAQPNHWWADVVYQVNTGTDGELALGWLKAYNVRYLVADIFASTSYKDFKNPDKFKGLTEPVVEIDGFEILEIPGEAEIIQAVDLAKVEKLKPFSYPIKPVLDKEGLMIYLEAIKKPVGTKIDYVYQYRTNPDLAIVKVSGANENTGILFKSTYDKGWRAVLKTEDRRQKTVKITKIGPDLMLVKPGTAGDYTLEMSYHRPLVEYLGYATTLVTIIVLGILVFKKRDFKLN